MRIVLLMSALLVVSGLTSVSAKPCPSTHTDIRVSEELKPPLIDDSKTSDQLKAMRLTNALTNDPSFVETVGLTAATISVSTEIRTRSSGSENTAGCVSLGLISIKISTAPNVYIAAGHGLCLQNVAMGHEMGHVEIDRNLIDRFVPIFRTRLASLAEAIGSSRSPSHEDWLTIRERVDDQINSTLSHINDSMAIERALEHADHDSPAEYRRVSMACPGVSVNPSLVEPRSRSHIDSQ